MRSLGVYRTILLAVAAPLFVLVALAATMIFLNKGGGGIALLRLGNLDSNEKSFTCPDAIVLLFSVGVPKNESLAIIPPELALRVEDESGNATTLSCLVDTNAVNSMLETQGFTGYYLRCSTNGVPLDLRAVLQKGKTYHVHEAITNVEPRVGLWLLFTD